MQGHLSEVSYDWAFARATRTATQLVDRTQRKEQDPIAELLVLPRIKLLAKARERFATPEAVEDLIERSFEVRFSDPKLMLLLAQLAQIGAEACSCRSDRSARALADLRAKVWSNLASALRVNSRLREAERALNTSEAWLERGSASPLIRAYVFKRKAVIQYSQGLFVGAFATADEAARIHAAHGQTTLAASALVSQAIALHYSGRSKEAIRVLDSAIPRFDRSKDGLLLLTAYHNLAAALLGCDEAAEVIAALCSMRDLYQNHLDLNLRLRARSLQGELLLRVGHLESAEKALLEARAGFAALDSDRDIAFNSYLLAKVHYQRGEPGKVRELLAEVPPAKLGPALRDTLARLRAAVGLG